MITNISWLITELWNVVVKEERKHFLDYSLCGGLIRLVLRARRTTTQGTSCT